MGLLNKNCIFLQLLVIVHVLSVPQGAVQGSQDLVPIVRPEGNLVCYSCRLDFRKRQYQWDHPCLGRHSNFTVSPDYLVTCGPNYTICRVERTEVNGVLTMLRRECTDICYNSCRLRGFGIQVELCERCCSSDGCNHIYPASHAPPPNTRSCWVLHALVSWVVTLVLLP